MSINFVDGSKILTILTFILSLICVAIIFVISKRTKDKMRSCVFLMLLALVFFSIVYAVNILIIFQIIGHAIISEVLGVLFILFMIFGFWKLRALIREISDYGQAFVLTSQDKYEENLVTIVKNAKNVCYITTEKSYKKIIDFFYLYGINTATIHFIDATGVADASENVLSINNTPESIKTTLDKLLKEKNIKVVILDNVDSIKSIKSSELPRFIQDMSLLVKAYRAQGFFIGKIENIGIQTINDVAMFVDKVMGDVKW